MNIQQLEYIIAVDTHRHFVKAAEQCNITQATLSMMIGKLEDELNITIFDRSKKPVVPTEAGYKIIAQAKVIIHEAGQIKKIVLDEKNEINGEFKIGIIPTLSPYLLPLFIDSFLKKFPQIKIKISELTTEEIISRLEQHQLDIGICATPIHRTMLVEHTLFHEEFVVYASSNETVLKKKYVLADDIDTNRLWMLEEGHCLRSQIVNLCALKKKQSTFHQLDFEAGSLETLKRLVESNQGITILPSLAIQGLTENQKNNLRYFRQPVPVREISIVTHKHFQKEKLISVLKKEIIRCIPGDIKKTKKDRLIDF